MAQANAQEHLYKLLKDFKTAMLVTRSAIHGMHARPMAVAELQPGADAYFATSLESAKIIEIEHDPSVIVLFQGASVYASVYGTAEIVKDRAEIERLWCETWRLWFPKGKDDPTLCLIRVDATSGEYWDQSGLQGIKFAVEALRAYVAGETPKREGKGHGKIGLS